MAKNLIFDGKGGHKVRKARGISAYRMRPATGNHRASGSTWPTAYKGTAGSISRKAPTKRNYCKRWS